MIAPRLRSTLLLASITMLPAGFARANTIAVTNSSFETLPSGGLNLTAGCAPGCSYSNGPIPGWTNGGFSGQFQPGNPTNAAFFAYLPDGPTVAYIVDTGAAISQVVSATVQNGVTYTFTVDIGHRFDANFTGSAGLLIGGSVFVAAAGTDPGAGNWGTYTATFTGDALTAGDSIEIQLLGAGQQADFDHVQLNDSLGNTATPEPSSIALLGTGILGAAGVARRKFRTA